MFVLPALTSPEVAMAAMTDLHLNWSWLASLIAAACIAFGLFGLLSRLLPGISDSMTEIQAELEARRAAEASLRISEARLRDITEASSDWFWEMDENLRFSYFSEGYGDIVGLSQQTLLGTTRQETDVPGVDPEIWEAHLADLAAHRSFRDFHITRARPDGSPVYLSVNGKPIFDEAGNFLGYRGAGTDITERKRVERRLIESESRLQSFIKNSPGAVSIKSVEGRYLLVNPVFENIFGMTSDVILGKRAEDLVSPSFAASSEAHDRAVIDSGEVVEREESLDLGQRVLELFSVKFPLRDNRGAITAIGAIQIDITERKRAEKALRHAHDELEERVDSRTAELRESEQSLANAQRIAHVGNWEWNIVTGELHWSDEIYRIFGLGPREFGATYEAFLEAVHPDDRTLVTTAVNQAIASHEPYSIEHRLLRPDGVVRFVHERGEVIYDDDDQPLRMSGTIQDITERKRVEERFRRYFDLPLVGSAIYAPDKTWIAVNDALCDLLGYSREELMEITWPEITHPDDLAENLRLFEAALSGTGSDAYTMDKRFIRKDGGVIHTIICGECVRKPDGAPDYFLVLVQDITERKTAVEELRQSEQSLANAQRIAHMGSWDWNLVTNKMLWSDESFHIYGLNRQDVSATHDTFLNAVHPDDSTLLDDAINDAIESHKPYSVEFRLRRPDGTVRFVHERGEVNYGGDDTPLRMSGTVQDVTERKAAEEALRKSQAWLSKAQSRAKLGFWDWSFDGGGTEHWSDNSAEILGFPTDDFYGGYEKYLEMVHPDDRGFVREAYHLHYPDNDDDSSG
jgi:PAS domain S-box-containing protein